MQEFEYEIFGVQTIKTKNDIQKTTQSSQMGRLDFFLSSEDSASLNIKTDIISGYKKRLLYYYYGIQSE